MTFVIQLDECRRQLMLLLSSKFVVEKEEEGVWKESCRPKTHFDGQKN